MYALWVRVFSGHPPVWKAELSVLLFVCFCVLFLFKRFVWHPACLRPLHVHPVVFVARFLFVHSKLLMSFRKRQQQLNSRSSWMNSFSSPEKKYIVPPENPREARYVVCTPCRAGEVCDACSLLSLYKFVSCFVNILLHMIKLYRLHSVCVFFEHGDVCMCIFVLGPTTFCFQCIFCRE